MPIFILVIIFALSVGLGVALGLISFIPPPSWKKKTQYYEQCILARTGFCLIFIALISSHWLVQSLINWPSIQEERKVFIDKNSAYITKEKDGAEVINLNCLTGRQYQEGDVVPITIYESWYGWLVATHRYKVENRYVR